MVRYYNYSKSDEKRVNMRKPKRCGRKNSVSDPRIRTPFWLLVDYTKKQID